MILLPTVENVALAAEALRAGELVGLPTETVYGIAANALDPSAVRSTYALKGRPADHPLIVHLASVSQVDAVVAEFPSIASRLAAEFWPGPLTMVLPKAANVPLEATGGLETVAIRVPDHPVARDLLSAAGVPVTAPSANKFMGLSPTRAEDIAPEVASGLACILDGGPCSVGLESTVVDLTSDVVRVLRPGRISREMLEAVVGAPVLVGGASERKSPGMHPRHYAPRTPLRLVDRAPSAAVALVLGSAAGPHQIGLPPEPWAYGAGLYSALAALDLQGADEILVEKPPEGADWTAVWDRLRRATFSGHRQM